MELVIYVDRLADGEVEKFEGTISSAFLGTDPGFQDTVSLSGEAYVAQDHLILKLQAKTAAKLPCSICNELTEVPLELTDFYHAEPLESIGSSFDFSNLLREDLLLQLPQFAECEGNCPEREKLKKFLNKPATVDSSQFPFSSL